MTLWRRAITQTPVIGSLARWTAQQFGRLTFRSSATYWDQRYASGGTSGAGSVGRLAEFKADAINAFVKECGVQSVLELGCGDGQQLALSRYPRYLGVDVSTKAIAICRERFHNDDTKSFIAASDFQPPPVGSHSAELTLSLDVIYHLIEDGVYDSYMQQLFAAAQRYVIIYSSNFNATTAVAHVRHRRFTDWIDQHCPQWRLARQIANPYPCVADDPTTSHADLYYFKQCASG